MSILASVDETWPNVMEWGGIRLYGENEMQRYGDATAKHQSTLGCGLSNGGGSSSPAQCQGEHY